MGVDGHIKIQVNEKVVGYDAWTDKLIKLNCASDNDKTEIQITLRPSDSIIVFVNDDIVAENESLLSLAQKLENRVNLNNDLQISTCKAIDYPTFSKAKSISKAEDYAKTNRKFSGYIAYEKGFDIKMDDVTECVLLEITDAGEDVEVFINGKSLGIQVLPPFIYNITDYLEEGENKLRIEVATTLERERGANKKKQAPIGIVGDIMI